MTFKKRHLKAATILALSFAAIILLGSLLLSLPLAQIPTSNARYIDHLFNAVSATCVTGLFIESIADSYNLFGQIVMLLLIQIGGLGTMSLFALLLRFLNKQASHHQKRTMILALNYDSIDSTADFIQSILKYTAIIELTGAFLLSIYFIPEFGWIKGLYSSVFLAISAFCNAGFDPFGNVSMIPYKGEPLINLTLCSLIILGGIGFGVWFDVSHSIKKYYSRYKRWPFNLKRIYETLGSHTKLVLITSFLLISAGCLLTLILEWNNPQTFAHWPLKDKLLASLFQSVTMRTAGFASMDYQGAHSSTLMVWIFLMFVGGAPAGTAGGLKVTSFAVMILFLKQTILNRNYVHFNHHNIPNSTIRSATVISALYTGVFFISSFFLQIFEEDQALINLMFECVSALATVGVSRGLTPSLSTPSHLLLMILMFIGRLGPMTILTALFNQSLSKNNVRYTDTNILIG